MTTLNAAEIVSQVLDMLECEKFTEGQLFEIYRELEAAFGLKADNIESNLK